ncbi:MAG: holin [Lachnospiraceae bacterium]|nr:holin [Lachnospiraceae bacterium]
MKWNWKEWLKAALIRAIRTFAQTFVGFIAVGAALEEVQWLRALSVSGAACVLSILTSLATGLPEVQKEPTEQQPPDQEDDNAPE